MAIKKFLTSIQLKNFLLVVSKLFFLDKKISMTVYSHEPGILCSILFSFCLLFSVVSSFSMIVKLRKEATYPKVAWML